MHMLEAYHWELTFQSAEVTSMQVDAIYGFMNMQPMQIHFMVVFKSFIPAPHST